MASVVFADPFTDDTRKAKRNLLIAAFVALLIAILGLKVTGFLGLQAGTTELGNPLAQGIACVVVVYFLVSCISYAYIDYVAWKFERERVNVKPYLDLISMLEAQATVTGEQVRSACSGLENIQIEDSMQSQTDAERRLKEAQGQLQAIDSHLIELIAEARPLYNAWAKTVKGMSRLSFRLKVRFMSLWLLDIVFPVALGAVATYRTHEGLKYVLERIAIQQANRADAFALRAPAPLKGALGIAVARQEWTDCIPQATVAHAR